MSSISIPDPQPEEEQPVVPPVLPATPITPVPGNGQIGDGYTPVHALIADGDDGIDMPALAHEGVSSDPEADRVINAAS